MTIRLSRKVIIHHPSSPLPSSSFFLSSFFLLLYFPFSLSFFSLSLFPLSPFFPLLNSPHNPTFASQPCNNFPSPQNRFAPRTQLRNIQGQVALQFRSRFRPRVASPRPQKAGLPIRPKTDLHSEHRCKIPRDIPHCNSVFASG